MIKHSFGLLLIWSFSMVQSQDEPCASHCICDNTNTTCVECEMWYVRNEQGMCGQYIDKVLLKNRTNIRSGENKYVSLMIEFFQQDLDLEPYAQNYYYYTLQYKLLGSTDHFTHNTFYKHYNNAQRWRSISGNNLSDGTSYELRVALYRMFDLRGWKEFLDATSTLIMTTKSFMWNQLAEYEILSSRLNGIAKRTFEEAEQYCNNLGGHLISVTSLAEHEYLKSYSIYRWIGLNVPGEGQRTTGCGTCDDCASQDDNLHCLQCASCRDKWRWTDGSPVQVTFWLNSSPRYNYRCASMFNKYWVDLNCDRKDYFICKRVIRNTSTSVEPSTSNPSSKTLFVSNAAISSSTRTTHISETSSMSPHGSLTPNSALTTSTQISDPLSTAKGLTSSTIMSKQNPSISTDIQTTVIDPATDSTTSSTEISSSIIGWQFAVGISVGALLLIISLGGVVIFCYIKGIKKDVKKQLQEYEEIYKIYDLAKPMPRDSGYLRPVNIQRQDGEAIAMGTVNEAISGHNQYQSLSRCGNSEMEANGDNMYNVIVQ